jgi:hypothetical protein
MGSHHDNALSGEIFDDYTLLSVDELSRLCAVERTFIIELVEEGVLEVMEISPSGVFRVRPCAAPGRRRDYSGICESIFPALRSRWSCWTNWNTYAEYSEAHTHEQCH